MAEEFLRQCKDCGNRFISSSNLTRLCPNCKRRNHNESVKSYQKSLKSTHTKKQLPSYDVVPLGEAVRLIDEYNRKNGTNYSYGTCPYSPEKLKGC